MKIAILTVLFNKFIPNNNEDSEYIKYFYIDNSNDEKFEINRENEKCIYKNGNIGLSKAYNIGISTLSNNYDYLIIMDDDSNFEDNFEHTILENIKKYQDVDIFIPKIISLKTNKLAYPILQRNNIILNLLPGKKREHLKTINSGLIIKLDKNTQKFNETFFLYCIDYDYITLALKNKKIKEINLKLFQNFSRESNSISEIITRTKLETKDTSKYYSFFDYFVNYFCFSIIYAIRFKKISLFIRIINIALIAYKERKKI